MTTKSRAKAPAHADGQSSNQFQALLDEALLATFPASDPISLGSAARRAEASDATVTGELRSLGKRERFE